jgi:hypothetical protein
MAQTTITDTDVIARICEAAGITDLPTRLVITAPKSATTRLCSCGCGDPTSGGEWLPGHDAKHKSALFARVRAGDVSASEELTERGWPQPAPKKAKAEPVAKEEGKSKTRKAA